MTKSLERITPMHNRRPKWIDTTIDKHDADANGKIPKYTYVGAEDDYKLIGPSGDYIQASELLDTDAQLRVLDIGSALGAFVLRAQKMGHIAHALSLHDFRGDEITDQLEPDTYVIGNAERLERVDGLLNEYDLIVSSKAFWLFVDPLGALEQAYDRLAPCGRVAIEAVALGIGVGYSRRVDGRITSDSVFIETVRSELVNVTVAESAPGGRGGNFVDVFAQRKPKTNSYARPAAFAIGYEQIDDEHWRYSPLR